MNSIAWIVLATLMCLCSSLANAESWYSLASTRTFTNGKGKNINTTIVTVDLNKAKLRVVSVPFEAAELSQKSSELSLRDFSELLLKHPKYQVKEWIVVNGGFSSYQVDVPLGLLVVDGKVYSTLTNEKPRRRIVSELSAFGQLRWSGILCQREDNERWEIIAAIQYRPRLCKQALQAGPVPVEPGSKVAVTPDEPENAEPYRRTIICFPNEFVMKIVLTNDETHLLPLAIWLSNSESAGGLGCSVALNLSGDASSGMAIKPSPRGAITFFNEGSFPIPTALIFESK